MTLRDQPSAAGGAASYLSPGSAAHVMGVLAIAWAFAYLDRMVISLAAPAIKLDLQVTDTQLGFLQGFAFSLFFALGGLPLGRLVDRKNRRNILIAGIVGWSAATVACGLASTFWSLFAARMALGVAEACLAPASFSLLGDYFAPNSRGRAMGVLAGATAIGTASSNVLGGLILNVFDGTAPPVLPVIGEVAPWRFVFLVFGLPGFLVAALLLTIREPARQERVAVAALPVLPYLRRNFTVFAPLYAAFACNSLFLYSLIFWGPVVFVRTFGMGLGNVGVMAGSMLLISGVVGGIAGGYLSDIFDRLYPVNGRIRLVAALAPLQLICASVFCFSGHLIWAGAAFAGIKFLSVLTSAPAFAALQSISPNEMRGQVTALHYLVLNIIGAGFAPVAVALVTDYVLKDEGRLSLSIAFVTLPAMSLMILSALFAARGLGRLRRLAPPSAVGGALP